MAKNLVEIILDSSESMQEPAFDKIEKFVIVKALLNEILEDILLPSSSKNFIRYFRNCEVFKVNDYQEINYLKAGGTTPLFKAIAISAHNLIKHGNGYRKSLKGVCQDEHNSGS